MIVGLGVDLCEIARVRAAIGRRERFAAKVLGPAELAVHAARAARSPERAVTYVATRFAAKEAFSKAIGLGMRWPMTWRACEVLNRPGGAPEIRLSGELAEWFAARGWRAHVTLTDEQAMAAAFVVVETADADPARAATVAR